MSWSLQVSTGLTDLEFNRWRKLLEKRAGIAVGHQLRSMLQVQINQRMQTIGYKDYSDYYDFVSSGLGGRLEQALLIEKLVVGETSFFRHRASYDFVSMAFARFLEQKAIQGESANSCFDVWSIGCASGEEPYSLAMDLEDQLAKKNLYGSGFYSVVATDISHKAVALARNGVYAASRLGVVPDAQKQHYFEKLNDGRYKVKAALAKNICFSQANIVDIDNMPMVKMDLVFTQNMLVYFRKPQRLRILDYIAERLKPGGFLVLGLGEVTKWHNPRMQAVDIGAVQVYQRNVE
ncbi:CheR family methyltransferase [Pseudoteredinibacter isoporae]|uniref:CheR family methyltransferase n=1 Tax=Pseudoteredinibacter isoporae TaxID=570281 RepID=UPI00310BA5C9